jgi:hypothetical protein
MDAVNDALKDTLQLRLALSVLTFGLIPPLETDQISAALADLWRRLREAEHEALRLWGIGEYYIVAPVDMLDPPAPDVQARITDALRTLDDLGLLIATG